MTITAEQAAKLLEGTTPGPWTVETGNVPIADTGDYDGYCRLMAGGRIIFEQWGDDEQSEKDANLAGAAPDLARSLIASEAARKLAEERLAALIRRAHDVIIRDEKDGAVWAQLLADMAREIDNG